MFYLDTKTAQQLFLALWKLITGTCIHVYRLQKITFSDYCKPSNKVLNIATRPLPMCALKLNSPPWIGEGWVRRGRGGLGSSDNSDTKQLKTNIWVPHKNQIIEMVDVFFWPNYCLALASKCTAILHTKNVRYLELILNIFFAEILTINYVFRSCAVKTNKWTTPSL